MKVRKESKEASAFAKFRLLMWKNFLQQWRHKIQTAVELLLPIATMALVLLLRSQIEPVSREEVTFPPIPAHTLNYSALVLSGFNLTRMSVAYSPENPLLTNLIRRSILNLFARNILDLIAIIMEKYPDLPPPPDLNLNSTEVSEYLMRFIRVDPYESSADLKGIYAEEITTRKVLAAIQFEDRLKDMTVLPNSLSYSLRFPERPRLNSFLAKGGRSWRSDILFPLFEVPGPRFPKSWEGGNDPGYINEMFIALQYAISTELIAQITDDPSVRQFDLRMQRYPHPPYLEDLAIEALQFLFPMFIMLSFSYTTVNIVRAVTVEKELQLKETMKIMGLSTWLHWTAWFCKQFLYLVFTSIFIVALLKINWFTNEQGFSNYAVFTSTPWTVLMFFLMLYLSCAIFFCFMISGFFSKGSTAALFGGVIWFLTYTPALLLSMDLDISAAVQAITCLSINSAMSFGFQLLLGKESTGGMQWGEFFVRNSSESSRFVFGHVVLMLCLDCVIYMLVALYLEQVLPGPFGAPKPWYFPLQKSYWFSSHKTDCSIITDDHVPNIIKEKDPTSHEVGVKMINLTKIYGHNIAVDNLNLNIYDDQITVLLGHNGAGKSTTISMLTGNVEITSGSVFVAGYDMARQTRHARAHIGLCLQHNVVFNEMTVREHLEFFARLKGFTGKELYEEIDSLITSLEMDVKRDYLAQGLSGGQKRRLCVGIALSGGARVVLLDEPTSGMDPASRRALWNLLQKQKKGRTMILTTHFMDEADFLGDRVAIMSSGRLQCVGSPYFLKRHYGVGYTLVVVKNEGFSYEHCTALINSHIPELRVKEDRGSEVTYNLLNDYSHKFEDMLNDLERSIDTIRFKNYGLIATTLEDVFMTVGSDVDIHSESDDTATVSTESIDDSLKDDFEESSMEHLDRTDETATGLHLLWLHVMAIWLKLWLVWIRSWGLLLLQVLVPVLLINTALGVMQYLINNSPRIMSRPLTLTEGFVVTETLMHYNGTNETSIGSIAKIGYERFFNETNNAYMTLTDTQDQPIDQHYLQRTEEPAMMGLLRNRLLLGATLNDNSATAWFSNFGYHDVAISLATFHNALLKGRDAAANIFVFNYPLEATYYDQSDMQLMVTMLSMQISSGIGSSMGIVSAVFIMFYIKERVSRAKLLQKASGVQPVVMWGAAWIFDWCWYNILSVTIIISCAAFGVIGLSSVEELGRMYLCLMVYGAAMLPLNYLCSHLFSGPALGFVIMFFVNVLVGMMGPQIVEALWAPFLDTKHVADIMDAVLQFFPLYSLVTAVRSLIQIGLTRFSCLQACDLMSSMPNITECTMEVMCDHFPQSCCVPENPYFDWEEPGVLRYLTTMLGSGLILWLILMFIEYRVMQKIYTPTRSPPPIDEGVLDDDVRDEAAHAERTIGPAVYNHALVSHRLSKYYGKNLAVDQLSFTVNDSECFGLLGVNGAGKTTTFKMLMADESISSGNAYVSGHSVKKDVTKVYENIGYCPQFDAVFGELTGRETLRVFSLLRGACGPLVAARAAALAYSLGFTKHLDKRVDQYSGGNRRKLSTALALVGGARLVFVDEPTSGVDAGARRRVWRALRAARRARRALLLTSHSMEECEALCTRLTVMVNGRFQCLGTPQHLKNKFSQGFTLTIKMKMSESENDCTSTESSTEVIKEYVNDNYRDPKLMEEYEGLLTYYLPDRTMPWSKMFGVMERAKRDFDVEDYSISQTTLEQIFLQFTKYQKECQDT
ncbi:phospholipid-transporting ATPase ABCA3-like [Epargyreus clarus]|uniref:phospholipid-transporting ATPase ABCA3-like n=1 Tax=Epargyreus clarus TaxID=520877 RepID=UPI003C304B17